MAGVRLKTINVDVRPTRSELPTSLGNTVSQKKRALFALLSVIGGGASPSLVRSALHDSFSGKKGPYLAGIGISLFWPFLVGNGNSGTLGRTSTLTPDHL